MTFTAAVPFELPDPNSPPVPVVDDDTRAFWDGLDHGRLMIQHCRCGHWIWQPKPLCPRCHHPEPPWEQVSGDATLVSWTVIHPPVLPAFVATAPYTVMLVELSPGVRMVGQFVDRTGALVVGSPALSPGQPLGLRITSQRGNPVPAWCLPSDV